jgi:hypothetical protein
MAGLKLRLPLLLLQHLLRLLLLQHRPRHRQTKPKPSPKGRDEGVTVLFGHKNFEHHQIGSREWRGLCDLLGYAGPRMIGDMR